MGNRAVITTPEKKIGIYLHWNGGRDTIEPLLHYCELKGYRPPSVDGYGFARICQVMGNFFGGSTSLGIEPYTTDSAMALMGDDNGVYVIDGWEIVDRFEVLFDEDFNVVGTDPFPYEREQLEYDHDEMLREFDKHMPEDERLGEFLDGVEVDSSELVIGDIVYMRSYDSKYVPAEVIGFGDSMVNGENRTGRAYVDWLNRDTGKQKDNPNNYPSGIVRIKPRRADDSETYCPQMVMDY